MTDPTLYLFFFFFSFFLSFCRSFLAISMTSLASFSGARRAGEKELGPPYSEERVEARDKVFLRFSLTASLSRSLALQEQGESVTVAQETSVLDCYTALNRDFSRLKITAIYILGLNS